jgi:hypothetical protein
MGAMTAAARRRGRAAAQAVGRRRTARLAARAGLVARTGFYLLLAGLVARTAYDRGSGGQQANANGAMSVIAETVLGRVALAAAALGFLAFGVVRVAGAVRDREADTHRRVLAGLQGLFYVALTYVPLSFLFGNSQSGSEQAQQQETVSVLSWPGGRVLVIAVGVVVLGVCAEQVRSAVSQEFEEGLDLQRAPGWVCRLVDIAGSVGIVARAAVYVPIGVFLIVAAVQADPGRSKGVDAELAALARQSWWGPAVLWIVTAGLVVFTSYSGLEARYRRVARAE